MSKDSDPVQKPAVRMASATEADQDQRIDNFLVKQLKGVPKSRIYRLLRRGEVRVNGRRVKPTYRLQTADRVRIPPVRTTPRSAPAGLVEGLLERVLFESDQLLVLDKPAGLAVHGGSGVSLGAIEALRNAREGFLELAHRLDRGTSGVLVVARSRGALTAVQNAFRQRTAQKRYSAVVHGHWRYGARREVHSPLTKYHTASGERRVRVDGEGKPASTEFALRGAGGRGNRSYSMMDVRIHTGRTHQIRVHALSLGHPVIGDEKYGTTGTRQSPLQIDSERMMLHARELRLVLDGERLGFEAPEPEAFTRFRVAT